MPWILRTTYFSSVCSSAKHYTQVLPKHVEQLMLQQPKDCKSSVFRQKLCTILTLCYATTYKVLHSSNERSSNSEVQVISSYVADSAQVLLDRLSSH